MILSLYNFLALPATFTKPFSLSLTFATALLCFLVPSSRSDVRLLVYMSYKSLRVDL